MRPGWWNLDFYPDHVYEREKVKDFEPFCGWETLTWLVKAAGMTKYGGIRVEWGLEDVEYLRRRDQALISALFETGGRLLEVLMARKDNFVILPNKIEVKGMVVVKRYKKIRTRIERVKELPKSKARAELFKSYDEKRRCWWRNVWETRPITVERAPFTIRRAEPLADILVEWIKQSHDYLFPATRKSKQPFLAESRAYTIVRKIEENFNHLVDEGAFSLPKIRLYPHWFRNMRASQLWREYHYDEFKLRRFFSWTDIKQAIHYTGVGTKDLEETWTDTEDMMKAKAIL